LKTAVSSDDDESTPCTGEGTLPFGYMFGETEKKRRYFLQVGKMV
jgi:hypothetical protein